MKNINPILKGLVLELDKDSKNYKEMKKILEGFEREHLFLLDFLKQ